MFPGAIANLLFLFLVLSGLGVAMVPIIVIAQPILPKTIEPEDREGKAENLTQFLENQTEFSPATKR